MILAPDGGDHHLETIFMTAYCHHTTPLDVGHTVPIGRPWCPGARCDHLLLSVPYSLPPEFSRLDVAGHEIEILWLMPVYASEARFRHKHDLESLEQLFDEAGFNIYDVNRDAVI